MKYAALFTLILTLQIHAGAQLINRFTWDTNPLTLASYGPNAISVSSYASSTTGGTGSTNGINPGNGRYDINLVLDGSYFNVPAMDISVDFRREETVASFFYRGSYFNFGMSGGNLSVNFELSTSLVPVIINSGNIFSVPDDHKFHNYRFYYDDNTGVAKVLVDAVVVYTYNGTAGLPLYWTGAGNVTIGKDMDATGANVAILDNLVIQKYSSALLPLQLLSFTAEAKNKYALINFTTTREISVTSFVFEKSANGIAFSAAKTISAANGYDVMNRYQFTDSLPFSPVSYYRLKMINGDGSFTYSDVKSVSFALNTNTEVTVYPNPTVDFVNVKINNALAGKYSYTVSSVTGQLISAATVQVNSGAQQIQINLSKTNFKGTVIIALCNLQNNTEQTFTIIKK